MRCSSDLTEVKSSHWDSLVLPSELPKSQRQTDKLSTAGPKHDFKGPARPGGDVASDDVRERETESERLARSDWI